MSTETAAEGGFRARLRSKLAARSAESVEASELQSTTRQSGATPIADAHSGDVVTVCGTIRSLTLRPRSGVPALEAELYDGSGTILLVWLGRRQIRGVDPGRRLTAHGRATTGR